MAVTIQTRRDDSTDWSTANPVLALGEIGIETDTHKAKYGDGFTAWNDLPYWIDEGAQIPDGTVQGQTLRYNLTDDGWEANSDLIVNDAGNVGIGTDAPTVFSGLGLHINAAANSRLHLTNNATGQASTDGGYLSQVGVDLLLSNTEVGNIQMYTSDIERMRIDSAGNVGIGTADPQSNLEVIGRAKIGYNGANTPALNIRNYANADHFQMDVASNDNARLRLLDGNATMQIGHVSQAGTGNLNFHTNAAERVRIDSSGNLLVGTTTGTIGQTDFGFKASADGYFQTSRNVNGAAAATQWYGNAGRAQVMGDGDLQNTNNSYGAVSDERLKENIVDATPKLDDILKVRVVNFNFKEGLPTKQIGVVAQEFEQIFPSLVKDGDDGYKSVKYSVLVPVLVKAIQEQQAQIDELRALIDG